MPLLELGGLLTSGMAAAPKGAGAGGAEALLSGLLTREAVATHIEQALATLTEEKEGWYSKVLSLEFSLEKQRLFEECAWAVKHIMQEEASENWVRAHLRGPKKVEPVQQVPEPILTEEGVVMPGGEEGAKEEEAAAPAPEGAAEEEDEKTKIIDPACIVNRAQFVGRLHRWPWLQNCFETLGAQNHLGFDNTFLKRVLGVMFEELVRIQGNDDGKRVSISHPPPRTLACLPLPLFLFALHAHTNTHSRNDEESPFIASRRSQRPYR